MVRKTAPTTISSSSVTSLLAAAAVLSVFAAPAHAAVSGCALHRGRRPTPMVVTNCAPSPTLVTHCRHGDLPAGEGHGFPGGATTYGGALAECRRRCLELRPAGCAGLAYWRAEQACYLKAGFDPAAAVWGTRGPTAADFDFCWVGTDTGSSPPANQPTQPPPPAHTAPPSHMPTRAPTTAATSSDGAVGSTTPEPPSTQTDGQGALSELPPTCRVEQGQTAQLAGGERVCPGVLSIAGTLRISSHTRLTADRVQVDSTGTLAIGTAATPAENVTLFLRHDDCQRLPDGSAERASCLEAGQLVSEGFTSIHGVPKQPWSLLTADCDRCSTLVVAQCDGWAPGDRLVVAATGHRATSYQQVVSPSSDPDGTPRPAADNFRAEQRRVTSVLPGCRVLLDQPLELLHRGTWLHGAVPTQAEVSNLDRSVLLTGPRLHPRTHDPVDGGQGIVTRQSGAAGRLIVRWARVEECGRIAVGAYCLHFHYAGDCPGCEIVGAVVEHGVNKGITLHGTHRALVDRNVVFDLRGASIYVEDGNEYGNTISNNVLTCPELGNRAPVGAVPASQRCMLNGVPEHRDSDFNEQSAIYAISPNNHIIGNRVSGHENALFVNNQGGALYGVGGASGKTCQRSLPFGITRGNVFHNCAGFGWYANVAYPTAVALDGNGFVTDPRSCLPFDLATGADNAANTVIEDHVEYFNDFSMGVYDMGDLSFVNTVSALNNKGLYAKTYRRGMSSRPLCSGCSFIDNFHQLEAPGGSGLVEFAATRFVSTRPGGAMRIALNHHCNLPAEQTGGLCASHYQFGTATFVGASATGLSFTSETDASDAVVLLAARSLHLASANAAFSAAGCASFAHPGSQAWIDCPDRWQVRIVRIYSPDRGPLKIINHDEGLEAVVPARAVSKRQGATRLSYTPHCPGDGPTDCASYLWPAGYTFLVRAGQSYTIEMPPYSGAKRDLFVLEYSEPQLPESSITLRIVGSGGGEEPLAGSACAVSSRHSRAFITPYGALLPQTGAWWLCKAAEAGGNGAAGWPTLGGVSEFEAALPLGHYTIDSAAGVGTQSETLPPPSPECPLDTTCPPGASFKCTAGAAVNGCFDAPDLAKYGACSAFSTQPCA